LVPHTTSARGTQFEIAIPLRFLRQQGVFDAQQIVTVSQVKLVRRLGDLQASELKSVEDVIKRWLAL
jgi:mRNA interferase MazF